MGMCDLLVSLSFMPPYIVGANTGHGRSVSELNLYPTIQIGRKEGLTHGSCAIS